MNVHYISSTTKYTSENDVFKKNGTLLTNEGGNTLEHPAFKALIKKETSSFIHKAFNNIIILIGAGASVLCTSGAIDSRFGKTVSMLAELINAEIQLDPAIFSLQELADMCKIQYTCRNIRNRWEHKT